MTLAEIIAQAVHTPCFCGAREDQPCDCMSGVHYARVARAYRAGYITRDDFAEAIHDDVFSGGDILIDPASAA